MQKRQKLGGEIEKLQINSDNVFNQDLIVVVAKLVPDYRGYGVKAEAVFTGCTDYNILCKFSIFCNISHIFVQRSKAVHNF